MLGPLQRQLNVAMVGDGLLLAALFLRYFMPQDHIVSLNDGVFVSVASLFPLWVNQSLKGATAHLNASISSLHEKGGDTPSSQSSHDYACLGFTRRTAVLGEWFVLRPARPSHRHPHRYKSDSKRLKRVRQGESPTDSHLPRP